MTVNPSDIPEYEPERDTAVEVHPFSFLPPGGVGDFRAVVLEEEDPKE